MFNRRTASGRIQAPRALAAGGALLVLSIVLPCPVQADPSVNGSYSWRETWDTKKSIRKVWSSLLAGYQQARNMAKATIKQMQLTASLAHSMEEQLQAWQTVAKRTEALLHADIWDENPITLVENLEENVFQKTDALLYNKIPNARKASADMNAARRAWVKGFVWDETGDAEAARKTLLGSLGLVALAPDQRRQKTREKVAYEIRSTTLAKTAARQDRMAYMTDDADANLSALGTTLTRMDASEAKGLSQMNGQLSENDFVQGQMETRQGMDRLELYSQILLSKAADYNRTGLAVHLAMQPLLLLSDELAGDAP